jgi:hypothetical protein
MISRSGLPMFMFPPRRERGMVGLPNLRVLSFCVRFARFRRLQICRLRSPGKRAWQQVAVFRLAGEFANTVRVSAPDARRHESGALLGADCAAGEA